MFRIQLLLKKNSGCLILFKQFNDRISNNAHLQFKIFKKESFVTVKISFENYLISTFCPRKYISTQLKII